MKLSLNFLLTTYLDAICDGREFENEDDFRDDLLQYLCEHGYPTEVESKVDSDPKSGKEYWLIDLMVEGLDSKYIPIEVKFNEESKDEIEEDIDKIDFCINHYNNIKEGFVILLTDKKSSNFEDDLINSYEAPFRFAIWHRVEK